MVVKDAPAGSIVTGIPAQNRPRTPEQRQPAVDPAEYIDPAMWI